MGEGYTYIYVPVHFSKEINLWAILKDWILRLNYQMMLQEQLQMVINGDRTEILWLHRLMSSTISPQLYKWSFKERNILIRVLDTIFYKKKFKLLEK